MIHSELGSYLKSTVMGDTGVDWDTGGVGIRSMMLNIAMVVLASTTADSLIEF